MIVVCTNCQAKFRVSDEKIGPRGAKVRCSRCQSVFVVHPDAGILGSAAAPLAGAGPSPDAREAENPFVANPVRASSPAPEASGAAAAVLSNVPPPLPFARPPAAEPAPPSGPADEPDSAPTPVDDGDLLDGPPPPDPFAPAGGAPAADPFAPGGSAESQDPFAPAESAAPRDPFAPAAAGGAGESGLPLADPSELLGAAAAAAPPPAASDASAPADLAGPDDMGLALEERLTPPPMRVGSANARPFDDLDASRPPPDDPFAGPEGRALDAASFDGEPLPGAEALALANEKAAAPAPAPGAAPPEEAAPTAAPPAPAAGERPAEPEPAPARHGSRLRSAAVNAIALVALLAIALAILVLWRSEGPIAAGSLRPAAIAAALRSGRSAGPFAAADLRSGEYERQEGPPVLFVRGKVVSSAAAPVGALLVAVEIVRDGQVVARGEALAGAVPTPEELWRAKDAASLDEVARTASARAARKVKPGEEVPFLVAFGEHPADLEGASLRVNVTPAAARGP